MRLYAEQRVSIYSPGIKNLVRLNYLLPFMGFTNRSGVASVEDYAFRAPLLENKALYIYNAFWMLDHVLYGFE
jgi:hypothetical protein